MDVPRGSLSYPEIEALLETLSSGESGNDEDFCDSDNEDFNCENEDNSLDEICVDNVNVQADEETSDNEAESNPLSAPDFEKLKWKSVTNIFEEGREMDKDLLNDSISIKEFKNHPGPSHDLPVGSSPFEYLQLLFPNSMCEIIRENTNKYAEFRQEEKQIKDKYWRPITSIYEIWGFLCVTLIMGIVRMPRLRDYWSTNPVLGNDVVKSILSRNRFFKILQYFHISNRQKELTKDDVGYNHSQKVEPLLSNLKDLCSKHLVPYKEIAIDEALLKFKGRLGIVQYMPKKPAKRGIKIWMSCTSFMGYVLNFDVYTGKKDKLEKTGLGLGYDVVTHLLKPLKTTNNHIFYDRFFTSVPLMINLLKSGHYACATLMTNRKFLPTELKTMKLKHPGQYEIFQCIENPNLLCIAWFDKKPIYFLSTNSKLELTKVRRKQGPTINNVTCPLSISSYNKHMGGVDQADQRRKYYSVARKSCKWWIYLFWFLFDTAISNAFVLYTLTNMPLEKKSKKQIDFKMDIINEIVLKVKQKEHFVRTPQVPKSRTHERVKIPGRKRICFRCNKLKNKTVSNYYVQSSYMCELCQICLCVSCFGPHHEQLQ